MLDNDDDDDDFFSLCCLELDNYDRCCNFFNSTDGEYLKIFHTNIRSFSKNIDELLLYLNELFLKIDLIILSECWLRGGEEHLVQIEGFDMLITERQRNQNDGLIIFVNNRLSVKATQITLGDALVWTLRSHTNILICLPCTELTTVILILFLLTWKVTMTV